MPLPEVWSSLGVLPPDRLVEARLALHDAAQPMAAAAYALLPAPEDHSHSNLLWSSERGGFEGRTLPRGNRCALDARTLRTAVLGRDGALHEEIDPVGRTLEQVFVELAAALRRAGESVTAGGLHTPEYDLPQTPVRGGALLALGDGRERVVQVEAALEVIVRACRSLLEA